MLQVTDSEDSKGESKLRHLWKKGQSGNPKGRQKGIPNKATIEIKEFCRGVLTSSKYRASLRARIADGRLPAAIESLMWYYAYGKPKETIELEGGDTHNHLWVLSETPEGLEALRLVRLALEKRALMNGEE
jgi:hypothetical protein